MKDINQTIITQYGDSPILHALIESFNDCIDPTKDFNEFLRVFWDLRTAEGLGLDFWGKVVGVSRNLKIPKKRNYFGFSQKSRNFSNGVFFAPLHKKRYFGFHPKNANFYNGTFGAFDTNELNNTTEVTLSYRLDDTKYRKLIIAKALANISNTSSHSVNKILNIIFVGRGRCWVQDFGGMAIIYHFEFALEDWEKAMITQSNVLPSTTGVRKYAIFGKVSGYFGFKNNYIHTGTNTNSTRNFFNGTFFDAHKLERIA